MSMNQFFETEMRLVCKVVLQIGVRYLVAMKNQCFRSHELHQLLTEVPHQPLLKDSNHHTHTRADTALLTVLRISSFIENFHSFCN